VEEYLLEEVVAPDLRLQARDRICHADPHRRRAADEDGRAPAKDASAVAPSRGPFAQHVAQVGPAVLDAPAAVDLVRHGEREPHQALLELGRRLGEAKVEARGRAEGARGPRPPRPPTLPMALLLATPPAAAAAATRRTVAGIETAAGEEDPAVAAGFVLLADLEGCRS